MEESVSGRWRLWELTAAQPSGGELEPNTYGYQLFLAGWLIKRDHFGELGRNVYPAHPENPVQWKHIGMETELRTQPVDGIHVNRFTSWMSWVGGV